MCKVMEVRGVFACLFACLLACSVVGKGGLRWWGQVGGLEVLRSGHDGTTVE